MWTEQHRKICQRVERRYPSDMTDGEWVCLEPLTPPAKPAGRPRETNMREAINAKRQRRAHLGARLVVWHRMFSVLQNVSRALRRTGTQKFRKRS
jgi:putative transposase